MCVFFLRVQLDHFYIFMVELDQVFFWSSSITFTYLWLSSIKSPFLLAELRHFYITVELDLCPSLNKRAFV